MSDASLPKAALRQRFDAFIAANTHKKASETDFRRKGSLGVGLIITHTLTVAQAAEFRGVTAAPEKTKSPEAEAPGG